MCRLSERQRPCLAQTRHPVRGAPAGMQSQALTACGTGYRPGSYLCASCADGWAAADDGSCRRCPAYISVLSPSVALWPAYQNLALLSLSIAALIGIGMCSVFLARSHIVKFESCARWRLCHPLKVIGEYNPVPILAMRSSLPLSKAAVVSPWALSWQHSSHPHFGCFCHCNWRARYV